MPRKSAGILLFRRSSGQLELFLVHMGGPFWAKKDEGAWSIPKGEFGDDEDLLDAARREFEEETGFPAVGEAIPLEPLKQPGGKVVHAWAMEGDMNPAEVESNTFAVEWPPKSGKWQRFPEVDRAEWFAVKEARRKILKGQAGFIDQLEKKLES
ncbi:MAG: NUDIX domain-containing protein [Candidatus Latescibacterota bacterium]